MHTAKSLKNRKKKIILFFYTENTKKKNPKICFSMHNGFNNKFIIAMRTRAIFQKKTQKIFCFLLVFGITNLYVKRIPDIKKVVSFI